MHPSATLAYTTSQLRLPRPEDSSQSAAGTLEISVWDNGESIGTTLRRAINDGKRITTEAFSKITDETFRVAFNPEPDRKEPDTFDVTHRIDPRIYRNDEVLLTVAAFLTGVTSQAGSVRVIDDELDPDDPTITIEIRERGGVGLRAIRHTAIDQFGGSVRYYSGLDRFTITKARGLADVYRVNIRRKKHASWVAQGNHMQISIPLVEARGQQ
jgi:hypothetical protein